MSKPKAVVLVSGGLDSCVAAAEAAQSHDVAFLHANYGQRTEEKERNAFYDLVHHFDVQLVLDVKLDALSAIGGSSLTDSRMPVSQVDLHHKHIPTSYVPFRNAHILAAATSWAEVIGATALVIGAVEEDSSGYPDCREDFFQAFGEAIREGTRPETSIEIVTPLLHLNKQQIVELGIRLNAPLHATWSCYQNSENACGVCDSCALRLRGFQSAGVEDPIPYEEMPDYR